MPLELAKLRSDHKLDNQFLREKFPRLCPILDEFQHIPVEFNHAEMVSLACKKTATKIFFRGVINQGEFQLLQLASDGAILHDIGKLGVASGGIKQSLETFYDNFTGVTGNIDNRTTEQRASQRLHPLISGYYIRYLGELGFIPREVANLWQNTVGFGHHESNGNGAKNSYPRESTRLNNKTEAIFQKMMSLVDTVVSMRELRAYRDFELPWDLISNRLLMDFSGAEKNKKAVQFCQDILTSVIEIDLQIRPWNKFPGIILNEDKPLTLIPYMFEVIWKNHRKRLETEYKRGLKTISFDYSRDS